MTSSSNFQCLNYHDGMFLTASLMTIEQNYFNNWLTYITQATYTAGVLNGLKVSAQTNTIVVDYGLGIDSQGDLLVFPDGAGNTFPIPNTTDPISVYLLFSSGDNSSSSDTINKQSSIIFVPPSTNNPNQSIELAEITFSSAGVIKTITDKRIPVTSKIPPKLNEQISKTIVTKTINGLASITIPSEKQQISEDIYYFSNQSNYFSETPLVFITVQTNDDTVYIATVTNIMQNKFTVNLAPFTQISKNSETIQVNWLATSVS